MQPSTGSLTPRSSSVSFTLVAFGLQPDAVTNAFGIEPSSASVDLVRKCESRRKEECGLWSYDTARKITSPELAEHFDHLLSLFRPIRSRVEEIRPRPNIVVHVRCKPDSSVFSFLSPRIDSRYITAFAELGASLRIELLKV